MSRDMQLILASTAATCLLGALLGTGLLQLARRRSLLLSIVVAALVPVATVSAAVAVNVQQMFISAHDSTVVSVALAFASVLALALSLLLGRRVASGTRELSLALRDLADTSSAPGSALQPSAPGRSVLLARSAPVEISRMAAELEATRTSLQTSRERERSLERSRRELVAFMSHDLRTPLAGLRALAEGLEDGVIEDQRGALRQMRSTVDRMNGLVGDLFELSRLSAGYEGSPPARRMLSLVELAYDVVAETHEQARRHEVDLSVDVADDGDRLAVQGNSDELTRAVTNLVGNAIRHTPAGGSVVVTARRAADGRARLAVSDGCGGIDKQDLERVFDVGWRAQPERSTRDAGAGLGLAIAKGVVESHDGSLTVANVAGGCRFELALPAASTG